ncbi:receptor like protein 21-like isoform X2 [Vigna unguiculata]|uniref:receptor like protein 21-like isoform X2 n=1 Tax=Vigna unguiculata TaxID=3917 RepID=UPI001016FA91|nr:receptor like protein 21-like isoform X2 [Vigna unguiculata]
MWMKRRMKSVVRLCFLIFLLLEAMWCCEGCWKEEREALLGINPLWDSSYFTPNVHTDCCEWDGVYCNSSTGRVAQLHLSYNYWNSDSEQYINYSEFSVLKDLKNLSLFGNIVGCVGGKDLPNLQLLDLTGNTLDTAALLSCLDGLPSLKSLSLRHNSFNTSSLNHVFESVSPKLHSNLEVLDISGNYLSNDILASLEGFTSLKELNLAETQLDSDLNIQGLCSRLRNLEILDLSYNNFNHTDIGSALSGLSSLNSLYLINSQLSWRSIYNISKLSSLEKLHLGSNNLNESGSILRPFKENDTFKWPTNLQRLSLWSNGLSNRFVSFLRGLPHLQFLDLSHNQLEGSLDISGLSTLSNLTKLYLGDNDIHNFVAHQGPISLSRLDFLDLDWNMIDGDKLRESLRALSSSIRELSISANYLKGTIVADDFHDLRKLERLTLDGNNNMKNEFFKSIGNLTSLKTLSLSHCHINDTLPTADWSKMKKLEELYLIDNGFEGFLPDSFVNMTSLRKLELSQNNFIGRFDSKIATLTSLEEFGFIENQFEVPISFSSFVNHSNLIAIRGKGNKIILDSQHNLHTWIPKFQLRKLSLSSSIGTSSFQLPKFLLYQKDLIILEFTSLKLEGSFPHWLLENNTKLIEVTFRNCSLTGTMQLPLRPLLGLWNIDVSNNIIIGEIPRKNISSIFPNLENLNLSRNLIQGSIPREFGQMKLLTELDLSINQLSGEISDDIFEDGQQLTTLIFSNNKLEGSIFTIPANLKYLSLNDNNFSGKLPRRIFNTSIISLDISNNHFVGHIPRILTNFSGLSEFRMSNNHFQGFIPLELAQQLTDLSYLDLSQNNLTGLVPSFLNSSVKSIHLSNNHLIGLSKQMFNGNSPLVMLDLSYNEISGNIQDLTQDLSYTKLNFLLLKGNHINGDIPKQLCQLIYLTMLDLSDNKFSGEIPHCLGTMPFDNKNLDPLLKASKGSFIIEEYSQAPLASEYKKEKASFTSKRSTYTYIGSILIYMSGINLSQNKLKGNIPYELGNLTRIKTLNLSHNDLSGQIPNSFSNLEQIESLDLSFNKLNGQIPPKLNILISLEVLSVAHNNLSGPIPEWTNQFATFDESSYEGNPFLCGPPLLKSCNLSSTIIPNETNTHKGNDSLLDIYVFCMSFVVSYPLALIATIGALYINPYLRQAWFYYMELVSLNGYYFIVDNFCRLCSVRNI